MKRSNAHEVTLRAVLGMLFMYLCPHLVRRQTLKSPRAARASVCVCSVNETARLCRSFTAVKIVCGSIFRFVLAINTQCTVIDMQIILNDILHDL